MLVLFLSGCSTSDKENKSSERTVESKTIPKDTETLKFDVLPIKSAEVLKLANEVTADSFNFKKKFKQGDGIEITTYQNDLNSIKILIYTKDNIQPFAVLLSTKDDNNSAKETSKDILASVANVLGEGVLNSIPLADVETKDGRRIYGYKIDDTGETYSSYKDLNSDDILSSGDRLKKIEDMIEKQEFKELLTYVRGYIDNNNPDASDFGYDIIDALSENENVINETISIYDDIEVKAQVFYKQEKSITEENFIAPYLNDSGFLSADVGFIKDGWIFFDEALINVNEGDNVSVTSNKIIRNTLQGGLIEEKIIGHQFQNNEISKLGETSSLAIRFKGESSDLNKVLSQGELESIVNLAKISGLKNILSNLVYTYKTF